MDEPDRARRELPYWLAINRCPDIGPVTLRKLLERTGGSLSALFEGADTSALSPRATDYLRRPDWGVIDRELTWLESPQCAVLTWDDPGYPALLREIEDSPPVLYAVGAVEWLSRTQVAVVGSRSPTPSGVENAFALARALSDAGVTITSGMALGIDGAAHRGALEGGSGTIAVAGTGLDRTYPARHRELAERIAACGVVVSEFPLGTPPLAGHFPRRNRIISGLAYGTLVVEAARRSGSLVTARLAAEQGRDVFAVPGSIHNPRAQGCHALIKQGAKLVETADDILEELGPGLAGGMEAGFEATQIEWPGELATGEEGRVLTSMGFDAASVDTLVARTGLTAERVSSILTALELRGCVAGDLSGRYQRVGGKV